jgi:hypothetical protein
MSSYRVPTAVLLVIAVGALAAWLAQFIGARPAALVVMIAGAAILVLVRKGYLK